MRRTLLEEPECHLGPPSAVNKETYMENSPGSLTSRSLRARTILECTKRIRSSLTSLEIITWQIQAHLLLQVSFSSKMLLREVLLDPVIVLVQILWPAVASSRIPSKVVHTPACPMDLRETLFSMRQQPVLNPTLLPPMQPPSFWWKNVITDGKSIINWRRPSILARPSPSSALTTPSTRK